MRQLTLVLLLLLCLIALTGIATGAAFWIAAAGMKTISVPCGVSQRGMAVRCIVSCTSIPQRLAHIHSTMATLTAQRGIAGAYLFLPTVCAKYNNAPYFPLPQSLLSVRGLNIVHCGRDEGPWTKLLPALRQESDPDTRIIVADDDHYYPENWAATLLRASLEHPDAMIGYGGWFNALTKTQVFYGSLGYIVRRGMFGNVEAFCDELSDSCRMGDDLSSSYYVQNVQGCAAYKIKSNSPGVPEEARRDKTFEPQHAMRRQRLLPGNLFNYAVCTARILQRRL